MKNTNESKILDAILNLEKKVDALTNSISPHNNNINPELIAVITAAAYNIFGKRIAVHNIKLINNNFTEKKLPTRINVIRR